MPVQSIDKQRVAIIGGTAGIGLAVARAAITEGAHVVVASSSATNVQAAVEQLGDRAGGAVVDAGDEDSIAAFFAENGRFDHLVFTAGDFDPDLIRPRPITELDIAAVRNAPGMRFWGALAAIKHGLPRLSEDGSITITSGTLSRRPMKGLPLATAFAGATEHLVRALAIDLAPVRVNAVCPGVTLSERLAQHPQMVEQMTAHQPLARGGTPAELAQAYIYLMRGSFTTGQVIVVDGGRTV